MLLSPDGQAPAGRPGLRARLAGWRRDFRPWRRQRPFVGGVLVALAGLEMLLSGPIKLDQFGMNIVLRFGVEGAQATILPLALTLLGILSIAQPVHRIFYGVIALAISVYSIAGVNLGGWVVGFLLGVVGGVIVVSWAPTPQTAEGDREADETASGAARDDDPAPGADASGATPADEPRSGSADEPRPGSADEPRPGSAGEPGAGTSDGAADGDVDPAPQEAPPGGGSAADGSRDGASRDTTAAAETEAIPKVESLSGALRALSQKSAAVVVAGALALAGTSVPASASDADVSTRSDDSFWCVVFGACDDEGTADPSASPSPSTGATDPGTGETADPGEETGGTEEPGSAGDPDGTGDTGSTGDTGDTGAGSAGDTGDTTGAGTGRGDAATGEDTSECQEPTQDGEVPPEEADVAPSDPCGEIDPQETIEEALQTELGTCVKVSFGGKYDLNVALPGQCGAREDGNVFSLPADLESRDLTIPLTGINGIGLANVPVKGDGGGRRDAIKISADKVVVDGFWLKSYAYDHGTVAGTDTRANFVSLEGDAHMYVSSIHANLPDGQDLLEVATKVLEGASLIELLLTATDARMGFLGATSDIQVWDHFREQVWGDPTDPIGKGPTAGTP
ncbi:DUF6114 domain-containing protein [Promicromonospora sp. NPDC050880]|uniref:DUF6114 domain-containing protein n=1 Tax=Promicromonospora sp. NPDC050880 TaxID=3364406 RepID=UPI0037A12B38